MELDVECGCCLPDEWSQNEGRPVVVAVFALCKGPGLIRF